MRIQDWLLRAYGLLLRMYPSAFRRRFATEMLELAGAAELRDWPLIFGDTGVGIVRCWFEGSPSTVALAEPNGYVSLGGSSVKSFGLGFVLSTVIIAVLAYTGYRWPPPCPTTRPLLTHVVASPQAAATTAEARPRVHDQSKE